MCSNSQQLCAPTKNGSKVLSKLNSTSNALAIYCRAKLRVRRFCYCLGYPWQYPHTLFQTTLHQSVTLFVRIRTGLRCNTTFALCAVRTSLPYPYYLSPYSQSTCMPSTQRVRKKRYTVALLGKCFSTLLESVAWRRNSYSGSVGWSYALIFPCWLLLVFSTVAVMFIYPHRTIHDECTSEGLCLFMWGVQYESICQKSHW